MKVAASHWAAALGLSVFLNPKVVGCICAYLTPQLGALQMSKNELEKKGNEKSEN
jgi:hypothetical protein